MTEMLFLALLIGHGFVSGQSDREGSEVDAEAVEKLFMRLGFEVTRFDDLNSLDFSINLKKSEPGSAQVVDQIEFGRISNQASQN